MTFLRHLRRADDPFPESASEGALASSAAPAEPADDAQTLLAHAAQRIDELVAVARGAAEAVSADASELVERSGHVINRDRLAAELARSLAERTDGLRRDAEELSRILSRAGARLVARAPESSRPKDTAVPEQPRRRRGGRRQRGADGPRVLVAQMAAADSERDEIAKRLRRDFELSDPDSVIDEVLGPSRVG